MDNRETAALLVWQAGPGLETEYGEIKEPCRKIIATETIVTNRIHSDLLRQVCQKWTFQKSVDTQEWQECDGRRHPYNPRVDESQNTTT